MILYFTFFLLGIITCRVLQIILSITPNYEVFKFSEHTVLFILMDLHIRRLTALNILKITYEECEKDADFDKVKTSIDEKYDELINKCILNMKERLPYKVEYSNLEEAITKIIKSGRTDNEQR